MQRVFPVAEQTCREHCGKPVLLFLTDGSEITGMLSRVEDGKLYLNEQSDTSDESYSDGEAVASSSKKKKKVKTKAIKKKKAAGGKKVRTAAANAADPFFGPYGPPPADYGGGGGAYGYAAPLVFDLSAVAALFVLD